MTSTNKNGGIEAEPYYHGLLPREDIKAMLRKNGQFLLRTSEPTPGQPRAIILSVMVNQEKEDIGIKHYILNPNAQGKYIIDKFMFDNITDLIRFHSGPQAGDVKLLAPIRRQSWELSHNDVEVTKKLGEGAFGEVSLGKWRSKNGKILNVAIKLAKLEALTKEQIKEIMREARLMRNFDHPNVIRLYGVAAGAEPLMLIMELAENGALDSFLQKTEHSPQKKLEMCLDTAWGLEYLHSKLVLHRDIAARNCLVGTKRVKISDFGLTREGTVYQMDPGRRVPIRWLAPETLRTAFYTQKTDVFSYGILCWEIFSNGSEPYPGMTVAEVNEKVKAGYRMSMPDIVQHELRQCVLERCWADNPNERWTMEKIARFLERCTGLKPPVVPLDAHHSKHRSRKESNFSVQSRMGKTKVRTVFQQLG